MIDLKFFRHLEGIILLIICINIFIYENCHRKYETESNTTQLLKH